MLVRKRLNLPWNIFMSCLPACLPRPFLTIFVHRFAGAVRLPVKNNTNTSCQQILLCYMQSVLHFGFKMRVRASKEHCLWVAALFLFAHDRHRNDSTMSART